MFSTWSMTGAGVGRHDQSWMMRLLYSIRQLLEFNSRQIAVVILVEQFKDDPCEH